MKAQNNTTEKSGATKLQPAKAQRWIRKLEANINRGIHLATPIIVFLYSIQSQIGDRDCRRNSDHPTHLAWHIVSAFITSAEGECCDHLTALNPGSVQKDDRHSFRWIRYLFYKVIGSYTHPRGRMSEIVNRSRKHCVKPPAPTVQNRRRQP